MFDDRVKSEQEISVVKNHYSSHHNIRSALFRWQRRGVRNRAKPMRGKACDFQYKNLINGTSYLRFSL